MRCVIVFLWFVPPGPILQAAIEGRFADLKDAIASVSSEELPHEINQYTWVPAVLIDSLFSLARNSNDFKSLQMQQPVGFNPRTALNYAAEAMNVEACEVLLKAGANPNVGGMEQICLPLSRVLSFYWRPL